MIDNNLHIQSWSEAHSENATLLFLLLGDTVRNPVRWSAGTLPFTFGILLPDGEARDP